MVRYPEEKLSIIILTNRDTILDFIPKGLAGILLVRNVFTPYKHVPATIDNSIFKFYEGEYESQDLPFPILVVEKDNKLYMRFGDDIELIPESKNKFYIDVHDVDIQLVFEQKDEEKSNKIQFIEGGVSYDFTRKNPK